MYNIKRCLSLLLFLIVIFSCSQSKQLDKIRILFIGNSYTYYNSTPEVLKALIQEKFPKSLVETKLISQGGMTLARHWQEKNTIETIRSGAWDYVVLQEQSKLGMGVMIDNDMYFGQTEQFFEYARKFDTEIKKSGAKTLFFMTWSLRDQPKEQEILTHAYTTIAKELNAIIVPVGLAWDKVRTNKKINLYDNDGSHPSPAGSYLASVALYATLLADNPVGLSGTISGNRLSSRGEPSLDREVLIELSTEEAKLIQEANWKVVKSLQKSGGYPVIKKPEPSYQIPQLAKGESIDLKNITGKWYGTSTYGFNYLGQIMEIKDVNGKPQVSLSFYSPHTQDQMTIESVEIKENQLILGLFDPFRTRSSTIRVSLNNGKMNGILESISNFSMYKHLNFSREKIHNEIDLSKVGLLLQSFESYSKKEGYAKAAVKHYEEYSKLIGKTYKPEEFYLNAVGYNFLRENKIDDALNSFELAMIYYPKSINTYDSYAEALLVAKRKDEALEIYTKAYELAKRTNHKNLAQIEENLNKLKKNISIELNREGTPTPPPPPPQ